MANYYVNGLFKSLPPNPKSTVGLTKFSKLLKWELDELNVPYVDLCCITDLTTFPVRFNSETGGEEYFNGTAWVEVPSGAGGAAATGITAFAGGGQGSATALTVGYNEVTVVATAGDSVKLPTASVSKTVIVKNEGVASLDVFPFLADTINDGTVNVAYAIPAGATVTFTALSSVNWETNSEIVVSSGVKNSAGTMFATFYPAALQQALTGAGAINVTSLYTRFTSSGGAQALTLANGTQVGQVKIIEHSVDGGSGVLTPTSLSGGTTITFTTAGETAELIWNGTAWVAVRLYNFLTPATLPVLA